VIAIVVCHGVTAAGPSDTVATERASEPVFEETEPPEWQPETYVPEDAPAEEADPSALKLQEVREILDAEPDAAGDGLAPAAPVPERSLFRQSLKAVWGLLVTLALLCVLAYLLKRYGRGTPMLAGPNLGKVIGKVYLAPRTHLHFVRTADKVLVVGVTPSAISLLAEFDAGAFEAESEDSPAGAVAPEAASFLDHLKGSVQSPAVSPPEREGDDEEIAALRQDIERLQHYLQEGPSGEGD